MLLWKKNLKKTLTEGPTEFTRVDSVVPKMIISYTKRKQGIKYIQSHFSDAILALNNENEDLGFSPATNIPVKTDKMKEIVNKFFSIIIKSINKVPYGLRYIGKKIYDYAKQRFPESEESELLLTVSYYVIYKFIGSALANCADYKIVENDEDISPNTQATLAYLAKSLQFIFRFTDIEDMKLVSLNNFMKKKHSDAKKYLLALIDVQDADQHLQVNRYNKMTGTTVPSIIIGAKEIVMLHDLLNEHKEAVIPLEDDPLNIILKELGGVPEIDEEDNREVQLELVNKFEVEIKEGEEEKDFKKKTLEETLSILENISIPPGKNFMEILVRAKLFAEKEGKTGISDAIKTLLKSLKKLEDKGLIVKGDGYSSFLKELFDEVNEMKRRIEEQKKKK